MCTGALFNKCALLLLRGIYIVLSISSIFQHIFFLFSQAFFFNRLFSILICILCKFTCVIFCSLLLSLLLYESTNPQAQLLKTCSIGKQQFWVLLTVHMLVGFFQSLFIFLQTIHLNHRRYAIDSYFRNNSFFFLSFIKTMAYFLSAIFVLSYAHIKKCFEIYT